MSDLIHGDITGIVLGAAFKVHAALGPGFLESIYERALAVALEKQGIPFQRQYTVNVYYDGVRVGVHRLDLLVANKVIVELKAVSDLVDEHQAIIRSYLTAASKEVALLLNFSKPSLEYKRYVRSKNYQPNQSAFSATNPRKSAVK